MTAAGEPIAIVGLGGIFPGAADLDGFWRNVRDGVDAAADVPAERWIVPRDEVVDPGIAVPDHVYSTRACLVDGFTFDPEGLDLDPDLVMRLDPMVHLALHAARQALRDARMDTVDRHRVSVVLGNIALPTASASALTRELLGPLVEEALTGRPAAPWAGPVEPLDRHVAGLPALLVARAFGLRGGAYTLDAACASSLYAVERAVDELHSGRADAVLAGGLNRSDSLYTQMGFAQLRALSRSGRCAPFDAGADGLVVGEGCGVFVLKRLSDALAAGDRIDAVIRGVGLSNDVAGTLLAPDSDGQLRAMREAYERAGWNPEDVDLVECHGTGTPVGDAVEFETLRALWRGRTPERPCVIGSVKSNVGHLLTGAGAAGLMKVLLALRARELPPTANFREPGETVDLDGSPFTVLSAALPWERRAPERPRRAAVSGFGFGGINAHLLIEEWDPDVAACREPAPGDALRSGGDAVAVVGMDAHFGPWRGLAAFARRIDGDDPKTPAAPRRWWGAPEARDPAHAGFYVDAIDAPVGRFRIPPKELEEMLPQQLVMLQAVRGALDDAQIRPDAAEERPRLLRTGVYIGTGLDLNTCNFHLRWSIAAEAERLARAVGADLTDDERRAWVAQVRDAVHPPLTAGRTVGALGGIVASRVAREFRVGGPSYALQGEETSGLRALECALRQLQSGAVDRALVGAVDLHGDIRSVLRRADTAPAAPVGEGAAAVVLKRLDDARRDGDRVHAVLRDVRGRVAVEAADPIDASTDVGFAGAASGLADVVKACVSLSGRSLGDRPWLRNGRDGPRAAAVTSRALDGSELTAVLAEGDPPERPATRRLRLGLFVVEADDAAGLREGLARLRAAGTAERDASVTDLARAWWRAHRHDPSQRLAVSLVATDPVELIERVGEAERLVAGAADTPSPRGGRVFFAPRPLGPGGEVAFVYPGSGSHYAGMGRALGLLFPDVLAEHGARTPTLRDQLVPELFWDAAPGAQVEPRAERLIFGQVALGTFVSDVLRGLGVAPDAVLGYSLGETASLFSMRAWDARDEMLRRSLDSTLFTRDLAYACDAARRRWGLPEGVEVAWRVGVVDRSAAAVRAALDDHPRAYLLIVNTPDECVVGGEASAVEGLVAALECAFHEVHGVTSVHCEVVREVADAYRDLHVFDEVRPPADVRFYKTHDAESYVPSRLMSANSLLAQALEGHDFPKLIRRAYDDGVRLFLEIGPGASCTRMIGSILGDAPHWAGAVCAAGNDGELALLRVLGRLAAERVPVDLERLYGGPEGPPAARGGPVVTLRPGGDPFRIPRPVTRHAPPPPAPAPAPVPALAAAAPVVFSDPVVSQILATAEAGVRAHDQYLRFAAELTATMAQNAALQTSLLHALGGAAVSVAPRPTLAPAPVTTPVGDCHRSRYFDRGECMEIAVGSIARVLGPEFAEVDTFPTRVRLPDEPLMLVDRIVALEGEPQSMTSGRVVTEHDVLPGAWYLDGGRIPTCIAVEAGQADLFLSGYLGIDFIARGRAVYRLLDAVVTFHAPLPRPGATIRYDIRIVEFFRQGATHLFRFQFDGTVDGDPLITMREGCAGFFTEQELAAGGGIVHTALDERPLPGVRPDDWRDLAPPTVGAESYGAAQVEALRAGDVAGCFGPAFAALGLREPVRLPGGRMKLLDRVTHLDLSGGRFGSGIVRAELDIAPDDWFLVCHFSDDPVMPGTLMYECCLHTLRVLLMRMGWVCERDGVAYEPVPGNASRLKCRGQVIETTRVVTYEVSVKELGYGPEPFCIADALMYADGRPVVEMTGMSVRMAGATRETIEALWAAPTPTGPKPALYDVDRILAFAVGKPSVAFGAPYRVFDEKRVIARLPGPPYQFLDRVTAIDHEPWVHRAGGTIEAQYDVPANAWYFAANRQPGMAFAVLLEIALQPCGWFAAYMGSALLGDVDMSFRNLGGRAVQHVPVHADIGTLTTQVRCTSVSNSGGMLIQNYEYVVRGGGRVVYEGDTYFGFFSQDALANQVGLREARFRDIPPAPEQRQVSLAPPFPAERLVMVRDVEVLTPGYARGGIDVDPDAWFFAAHFFQDPVWPGSLGLEALLQLLKVLAAERWGTGEDTRFDAVAPGIEHRWTYRGQILPTDSRVTVEARITSVDDATRTLTADGLLGVDGRMIYEMSAFSLRMSRHPA